jgi:hypothetical protein
MLPNLFKDPNYSFIVHFFWETIAESDNLYCSDIIPCLLIEGITILENDTSL